MDLGLKGKSVLVTAASKGLGKASALEFAREGAKVTIASRNLEELKRAAGEIELATGQKVTVVQMDVTREEDIERAVKTAAEAGNGLDVLVTNAGGPPGGTFDDFADEAWMGAFELNLLSAIRLIRTSLPYIAGQGRRKDCYDHFDLHQTADPGADFVQYDPCRGKCPDEEFVGGTGQGSNFGQYSCSRTDRHRPRSRIGSGQSRSKREIR